MNPGMLAVCAFPWSHFTPILPKALGGGTTYRIPEFLSYCTLQNAEFGTNIFICILCVQVFSVCVHHEPVVPSKMRRGCQIPLELEVQMVVGCCVDAVIKPQLSARAANAFNLCSSIINHFYLAFSLCSSGWPQTRNPASASWMLALWAWATTPEFEDCLKKWVDLMQ